MAHTTSKHTPFFPQGIEVSAQTLLHGVVASTQLSKGWIHPWRVTTSQYRQLGSCRAWHPGLYRQMARTSAGIFLEFDTDSSELVLEVALDEVPEGSQAMLDIAETLRASYPHDVVCGEDVRYKNTSQKNVAITTNPAFEELDAHSCLYEGLSIDIDDRHLSHIFPDPTSNTISIYCDDPATRPLQDMVQLPGFGGEHHVRIWLPSLRSARVRNLWGNGSYIRPRKQRPCVLVLGDSISQGFITGCSACTWSEVMASLLNVDVVNQAIGGAVFQSGLILGLSASVSPSAIIVALGANYRYEACSGIEVMRDIHQYFEEIHRVWPHVPTWVTSPIYHSPDLYPEHPMSIYHEVEAYIKRGISAFEHMHFVSGTTLMDHDVQLFADAYGHPGMLGARELGLRMALLLASEHMAISHGETLRERALRMLGAHEPHHTSQQVSSSQNASPKKSLEQNISQKNREGMHVDPVSFTLQEVLRTQGADVLYCDSDLVLIRPAEGEFSLWVNPKKLDTLASLDIPHMVPEYRFKIPIDKIPLVQRLQHILAIWVDKGALRLSDDRVVDIVRASCPCQTRISYYLAWYDSKKRIPVSKRYHFKKLQLTDFETVMRHYHYAEFYSKDAIRQLLSDGKFIGGYEDDKLVGFIGEHIYGALGMLEVFEPYRRRGWGKALLAYKVNEWLSCGRTPWTEIMCDNKISSDLHTSLGFHIDTHTPHMWMCSVDWS